MKISCIDIGGTYIKSGVLEDGADTQRNADGRRRRGAGDAVPRGAACAADAGRERGVSPPPARWTPGRAIRLSDNIPRLRG